MAERKNNMTPYTETTHKTDRETEHYHRILIWANDLNEFQDVIMHFGFSVYSRLYSYGAKNIHQRVEMVLNIIQRELDENSKLRFPKKYPDFDLSRIQVYRVTKYIEKEITTTTTVYEDLLLDDDHGKEVK